MTTLTQTFHIYPLHLVFFQKCDQAFAKILPRPCMLISLALLLVGMSIPAGMLIGVLPLSLGLGFVCLFLTGTGCGVGLILYGEI